MEEIVEYCRYCQRDTIQSQIVIPIGPHYGEQVCTQCEKRVKFLKKPENETKRPANKYSPKDLGIEYCESCLRSRSELVNYETLEVHHKEQICNGGKDIPENIWVVCTPCHRIIHYNRTYLGRNTQCQSVMQP